MRTSEKIEKDKVKAYLKSIGAYYFLPVQMGLGSTTLDILCCINGRFVGIEMKAPGKKSTRRQELVMQEIRTSGGYVAWFDDGNSAIEWIKDVLRCSTQPFNIRQLPQ